MGIANEHNLAVPIADRRPYGVAVRLRRGDPFRKLLGDDWSRVHWYATAAERDRSLAEMSRKHDYSRTGDAPALIFEKTERSADGRGA
jgi:hypothetical protein